MKDVLGHYEKKWILQDINLILKPGKTYLVMGPPSCGKTSLLKAVAGLLKAEGEGGKIEYNGVSRKVSSCVCNEILLLCPCCVYIFSTLTLS